MNGQVNAYLSKYPGEIVARFQQLRQLIYESTASTPEDTLWAILATYGYEDDYATSPFETAVQRLWIHSKLDYVGLYSVEDEDDLASFRTAEAKNGAREFARRLLK